MWSSERDDAIRALFLAGYPRLVNMAFAMVGDWGLAEQLAQESYLRLYRRWRWIRDPRAAPAYLQRTVLNLSRSSIRRRILERRALSEEYDSSPEPDVLGSLALRRAISALPARRRACIVLRYLADLTEAETADLLGISVGTVKSQTHKALRQLRELLAESAAAGAPAPLPRRIQRKAT
jgi:RNA polymerase sigma-70 factor (sigma-E family)